MCLALPGVQFQGSEKDVRKMHRQTFFRFHEEQCGRWYPDLFQFGPSTPSGPRLGHVVSIRLEGAKAIPRRCLFSLPT